jgi:aminoglycoside phosphotransferase (APT) family kinase protein
MTVHSEARSGSSDVGHGRRIEANLQAVLDERLRLRAAGTDHRSGLTPDEARARLTAFLARHLDGDVEITDVVQLPGGGANESYRFHLAHGERSGRCVLRIKSPGACCATDAEREFAMLSAVGAILPVPEPRWVATDPDDFGAPALITSFVDGVAAPTKDVPLATGLGTVYGPRLSKLLAPQFVRYLADLHTFDWTALPLDGFDRPRPQTTDAVDWRLAYWDRSWDQDAFEPHPTITMTREWLWRNRPVVDHVSLLHGDYRNGNFLFDEDTGEIQAVVDWELCSLGDRHSDLAYALLPAWGSPGENGEFLSAGLMEADRFIEEYQRISGLEVDRRRLDYYMVYNLYWAVISLIGTAPRNADLQLTQLDVMYNFIYPGLGAVFCRELDRRLTGARS